MNTNEKNIPSIYMYHQTEKSQKRKKNSLQFDAKPSI